MSNGPGTKPKSLAIDATLHRYLKLITARDAVQMNSLTEPPLWDLVRDNREWIEKMTGEPISLPDPKQLALIGEGK